MSKKHGFSDAITSMAARRKDTGQRQASGEATESAPTPKPRAPRPGRPARSKTGPQTVMVGGREYKVQPHRYTLHLPIEMWERVLSAVDEQGYANSYAQYILEALQDRLDKDGIA